MMAQEGMILVEGGTFPMGSTPGAYEEQPVHNVTISSFLLDAKEITVAQYRTFCTATGRSMPPPPSWGWSDDNPIVEVSWDDAYAYAAWVGKRLPTEAEWEFAARGGIVGHGYTYSGSNSIEQVAWYISNAGDGTRAVGTKLPNELGLFDMTGNAREWCSDWYGSAYYSVSPAINPQGPSSGPGRVLRGGAWGEKAVHCRVAARTYGLPTWVNGLNGFRCARTELTSVGSSAGEVVSEFTLNQNYPNPFNPLTTIRYALPRRSHVTLTVYNTLGEHVAVLQNGEQETGYHEVKFDAAGLSSGLYVYRIQAGDYVATRKLLLLR